MEAFNVKFVGVVEKHRLLYDSSLTEYSRKDVTDKAWRQVAAEVSLSVSECRERWKNLRTAFLRRLKAPPGGPGSKVRKYYLHDALQFILPFTKAVTKGHLLKNAHMLDVTDFKDLESQPLHSTPSCSDSSNWDPFSSPPSSPLPQDAPASSMITSSMSQHSTPLANEQYDITLLESKQLTQSEPRPNSRKQPSGKKRKILTCESEVDRKFAENYAAKKSTACSKDERKEAILQFLNSLVPDLLTLTDPQLRSFKRKTLLLIDEVTCTTPLEYIRGPSYSYTDIPRARSSETPSPAGSLMSSYDPSASVKPKMEILGSDTYDLDLQTHENPLEPDTS